MLGIWQAHHAERDEQPGQTSEDGYQQRHLKGEVPCLGVDLDDLVLRLLRLARPGDSMCINGPAFANR